MMLIGLARMFLYSSNYRAGFCFLGEFLKEWRGHSFAQRNKVAI